MQIGGQQVRSMIVQTGVEPEVLLVIVERRRVFQVALVLREDRGPVLDQAEGGFQFAAVSQ